MSVQQIADGVVLHDISEILLRHPAKKYRVRKKAPTTLFIHHSGADNGRDGSQAWAATAGYHVVSKGWPGIAYHYGITLRPSIDDAGNLIIHKLNQPDTVSYHTKGCNRFGAGLCLQGHHGQEPLSDFQIECLEAFLPWWAETYERSLKRDLGWHSNALRWGGLIKPSCPGSHAVRWLSDYLARV